VQRNLLECIVLLFGFGYEWCS